MSSIKQVLKQIERLGKRELSPLIGKEDEESIKTARDSFYKFVLAFHDKSPNEFDHWHTAWGRYENTVRLEPPATPIDRSKRSHSSQPKDSYGKNIKI